MGSLARLDTEFKHCRVVQSLLHLLLICESVHSSRIEGSGVTLDDMLEADRSPQPQTEAVSDYEGALLLGVELIRDGFPVSSRLFCEMHRILMLGARRSAGAGEFLTGQNFVGPDNDIRHAVYVPVPAGKIAAYLANLEEYVSAAERPFCR